MADLDQQVANQLANIEARTGRTVLDFAAELKKVGFEKHGQMVKYLKTTHQLGHGDANLITHKVREAWAGGPAADGDLLADQYAGGKAHLLPAYHALRKVVDELGGDVQIVIQKTAVSFRRKKQFALARAASSKRIELGLNLDETPAGGRVKEAKGMCTHKADITGVDDVDEEVRGWLQAAYERAG